MAWLFENMIPALDTLPIEGGSLSPLLECGPCPSPANVERNERVVSLATWASRLQEGAQMRPPPTASVLCGAGMRRLCQALTMSKISTCCSFTPLCYGVAGYIARENWRRGDSDICRASTVGQGLH